MKSGRLWLALLLVPMLAMMGCEGDAGPQGPEGPQGEQGPAGPAGENALNTCSDCHTGDVGLLAIQTQFNDGAHAETVYWPRGGSCSACHNHNGFTATAVEGGEIPAEGFNDTVPVNCRTCHQVHNDYDGEDYALTTTAPVTLQNGSTYDNGTGNLCVNCHQSRPINPLPEIGGDPVTFTSFRYGPHYGAQGNIAAYDAPFEFAGSVAYPTTGTHAAQSCNACHMIDATAEYGLDAYVTGGHTWRLAWDDEGEDVEAIEACTQCHTSATSFDFLGGQSGVQAQLDQLAGLLDSTGEGILDENNFPYAVPGTYDADVAAAFLNWKFVYHDGSRGTHNPAYVSALLTNTIEAMEARLPAK